MAQAPNRPQNSELFEGMTDGKYKKIVQNRGGFVEPSTYLERSNLYDRWYGIHETPLKTLGDGRAVVTEDFVVNPEAIVR